MVSFLNRTSRQLIPKSRESAIAVKLTCYSPTYLLKQKEYATLQPHGAVGMVVQRVEARVFRPPSRWPTRTLRGTQQFGNILAVQRHKRNPVMYSRAWLVLLGDVGRVFTLARR
jgi:hypothetical protein